METVIDIGYQRPHQKKVLVVDDEPALQTLIFDTLEGDDYRVIPSYNGRDGVEKAETLRPDLIIMDVMMPDIGGYEAIRLLNTNKATRNIPVIVMTAKDFDDSTIQLMKQEPNVKAFLPKPFRPKDLRETVRKYLQKQ